jgi:hypothetical protein
MKFKSDIIPLHSIFTTLVPAIPTGSRVDLASSKHRSGLKSIQYRTGHIEYQIKEIPVCFGSVQSDVEIGLIPDRCHLWVLIKCVRRPVSICESTLSNAKSKMSTVINLASFVGNRMLSLSIFQRSITSTADYCYEVLFLHEGRIPSYLRIRKFSNSLVTRRHDRNIQSLWNSIKH